MTRIKAVGLALVAVFAMGAMATSAIALPTLEAGKANVSLMGEQPAGTNDVFTVDGSNVTCNTATYNTNTTTANGSTNSVLHPEYTGCTAFGFIGANITTTNCNYRGMANGTQTNMKYSGAELEIICNTGTSIQINAGSGTCIANIGPQTLNTGLIIENTTAEQNGDGLMDFDLVATNVSVSVTKNVDGFGCAFSGTGATTGTYNGRATIRCTDPAEPTVYTNCTVNG